MDAPELPGIFMRRSQSVNGCFLIGFAPAMHRREHGFEA
jgi:hypothetical protein